MATDENGDWFDSNPPPSDPFTDQINALYQQYAGRPASAGEIAAHRGNPGGVAAVEAMLKPAAAAPPPTAAPTYGDVQGFVTDKLKDPNYSSAKYTPAAKAFSAAVGAGTPVVRGQLDQTVAAMKAQFPNAKAVGDDKIDFGDGNGPIDVVQQNGSVWFQNGQDRFGGSMNNAAGGGAGGGAAGFTGAMNNALGGGSFGGYGSYSSAPWTGGDYTPPPLPSWLQGQYVAPTWQGGDFHEPTMAEVEATPGYQTRMDAGQRVLESSAAAKGTILNGGTQKALARYGQDYGTGEYQTARGNAYQDYMTKYGQFTDSASRDLGQRNQNLGEYNNAVGIGQNTYANRYAAYLGENNRTLSDYMTNYNVQHTAETDYWKRLNDLYSTGAQTAAGSYKPG